MSISSSNRTPQFGLSFGSIIPKLGGSASSGANTTSAFQKVKDELAVVKKTQDEHAKKIKKANDKGIVGTVFGVLSFIGVVHAHVNPLLRTPSREPAHRPRQGASSFRERGGYHAPDRPIGDGYDAPPVTKGDFPPQQFDTMVSRP